ncbi:DUF5984 family protein [Actinoplanes sp. CA-054009]
MIRFRFELYPLDEVSPWGGEQPRLHWFGLTEGWYWIEIGGHELLHEHYLDFGYIRNSPDVRLWRTVDGDRDEVTLDWRHQDDGEIGFTAGPDVRVSVPTTDYLEAVRTLDRELMDAMRQRIDELRRRGGLPGVELDLAWLEREHEDRTKWLGLNLARSLETDWEAVTRGARSLLARERFNERQLQAPLDS